MSAPTFAVGDKVTRPDGTTGEITAVHDAGHPDWTVYDVTGPLGIPCPYYATDLTAGGAL